MSQLTNARLTRPQGTEHMNSEELLQFIMTYSSSDVVKTYFADGSVFEEYFPENGLIRTYANPNMPIHYHMHRRDNQSREEGIQQFLADSKAYHGFSRNNIYTE